jgi:hypothetical protein
VFNRLVQEQHGLRLYKSGQTNLPSNRAFALHIEAERRIKHSTKLWRNMRSADPSVTKPFGYESHHIVASREPEAELSRKVLFSVNIGINDAKNGVNLDAQKHRKIHEKDTKYYTMVNFRMASLYRTTEEEVGNELMDIGEDIQGELI